MVIRRRILCSKVVKHRIPHAAWSHKALKWSSVSRIFGKASSSQLETTHTLGSSVRRRLLNITEDHLDLRTWFHRGAYAHAGGGFCVSDIARVANLCRSAHHELRKGIPRYQSYLMRHIWREI